MPERIIYEDETRRDIEVTSEGWPDEAGSVRSVRTEWKPGHEPPDRDADFRSAINSASTLAELKAVLLGDVGPGAAPRPSAPMRR